MLHFIICAACMITGALALTVALFLDYGHPVAAYVPPKFPSYIELVLGVTILVSFSIAGWIAGGMQ